MKLKKVILIPPSKSHTIRLIAFALLSKKKCIINSPLFSADTLAAINAAKNLGAKVIKQKTKLIISPGSKLKNKIDVGNSGTTLNVFTSIAALQHMPITFTGDSSIKKRPIKPLLNSLIKLGAKVKSYSPPFSVNGPINGKSISVSGITSQYLTSLLIVAPLLNKKTTISIKKLNELPYIDMTLTYFKKFKIKFNKTNYFKFTISPNQKYPKFNLTVPADWSSAAFPICTSLFSKSPTTIKGLDLTDTQGDKKIISILKKMGAKFQISKNSIKVLPSKLKGIKIDLNDTPDLLPILAITACFAKGKTTFTNVSNARIKETDRIAAIYSELKKLGAKTKQTKNGLIIHYSKLKSANVSGHKDHRIIMSLLCLSSVVKLTISNKTNLDASYPNFMSIFSETLKS